MFRQRPNSFFGEHCLDESLVLTFCPNMSRREIDLVLVYAEPAFVARDIDPATPDPPNREFLWLRFAGVDAFRRVHGAPEYGEVICYQSTDDCGGQSLYGTKFEASGEGYRISFSLSSLGVVSFRFLELESERKTCCPRYEPGGWYYRDIASGKRVDFHLPFGDVARETGSAQ